MALHTFQGLGHTDEILHHQFVLILSCPNWIDADIHAESNSSTNANK